MSEIGHTPNDIALFIRPKNQLSQLQTDVNTFIKNKKVWSVQMTSSGNDVIISVWFENIE